MRPEKVQLLAAGEPAPPGSHVEAGRIDDVVYLGVLTRYVVTLDSGDRLVAVRQNLETAAADALESQGRPVRVAWRTRPGVRDQRRSLRPRRSNEAIAQHDESVAAQPRLALVAALALRWPRAGAARRAARASSNRAARYRRPHGADRRHADAAEHRARARASSTSSRGTATPSPTG